MMRKNRKCVNVLYCILLLGCILTSCSTTKNLPQDEILYIGVDKMDVFNEDFSSTGITALEEVKAALSYPPNNAILGSNSLRWPIPLGLWVYNNFEKYKEVQDPNKFLRPYTLYFIII